MSAFFLIFMSHVKKQPPTQNFGKTQKITQNVFLSAAGLSKLIKNTTIRCVLMGVCPIRTKKLCLANVLIGHICS